MPVFKTGAFNRSAIPPMGAYITTFPLEVNAFGQISRDEDRRG